MTNKIHSATQKFIENKFKTELRGDKNYVLESSITLINDSVDILLGIWKLTPREVEVILNISISKIKDYVSYNRNDNLSELVALLHLGTKEEQILKTRETECLLNQWVEFGKKPIYETKIYSDEKPSFASRSDLLGDLTKWWVNAVDNNHFKPKFN